MATKLVVVCLVFTLNICLNYAVLEPGIKFMHFTKDKSVHGFSKSLFKGAKIYIKGDYTNGTLKRPQLLQLHWTLYCSECAQFFAGLLPAELQAVTTKLGEDSEYFVIEGRALLGKYGPFSLSFKVPTNIKKNQSRLTNNKQIEGGAEKPVTPQGDVLAPPSIVSIQPTRLPSSSQKKITTQPVQPSSKSNEIKPPKETKSSTTGMKSTLESYLTQMSKATSRNTVKKPTTSSTVKNPPTTSTVNKKRQRRAAEEPIKAKDPNVIISPSHREEKGLAAKAPNDGNYLLLIRVSHREEYDKPYNVEVEVRMKSATGYLSAAEWPLLPFYGAMSLLYLAYGVVWLIVSACQWRELLRVQFWVGGVIALGMLEKAILFSEYNNVNNDGVPAHGLVVFAQVISCIKRTLSRILIIIVSMGFGIVKPRLGAALHRVLAVATLYFVLCVIEGSYRVSSVTADVSRKLLLAAIPLSVLDAVICWWIFMSLMQTMRTLRIRKNVVKLTLYRHFTNILVVSVIASVAFMIWAIKYHHLNVCIKDWKELWIDDAFWHFLFAIVLLAIMVLWRPTANNQRYAFTPLVDVGDDDDDDMTLSDAFHGMKMRGKSDSDSANNRAEKNRSKVDDDLKWVEENIPSAAGGIDTALPTLLDSDEEVMTTKLEMSKME